MTNQPKGSPWTCERATIAGGISILSLIAILVWFTPEEGHPGWQVVVLVGVGLLPWLLPYVEELSLPGGVSVRAA